MTETPEGSFQYIYFTNTVKTTTGMAKFCPSGHQLIGCVLKRV